jgi:hypothetical protein
MIATGPVRPVEAYTPRSSTVPCVMLCAGNGRATGRLRDPPGGAGLADAPGRPPS